MDIGTRIKELRKNLTLTQKEVAEALQVSQQALGDWENQKKKPTADKIEKIASFFSVSADYLLGKTDIKKSDEINLSDFELLYRKTSNNLSDEEKAQLEIDLKDFLLERERLFRERDEKRKNGSL
ncbi:helix-turn-helix domain-containing protein [Streptococcus cuniculi]|uniref:Helix-turn-helix domain-containing protein n=1 Tax=Streptococcus cuniculi TaxID=1432788 RepID=A0A4Y9JB42_9STRE|nr:helix-turn-helix domain-containing protein [Streptococcus cuniculi]MBF0777854.1 helix-turn-helix domain-containing protein [Streptococcus cuniculi]TFU98152.1 helix-turn-helix domain-containing protein [Streptococcus cuniculi]